MAMEIAMNIITLNYGMNGLKYPEKLKMACV